MASLVRNTKNYGGGANATGGTGGTVYNVSTYAELKTALEASGTRIVNLTNDIRMDAWIYVFNGNLTLTSSPLSTIYGGQPIIQCSNVIIENLRFRPGIDLQTSPNNTDGLTITPYLLGHGISDFRISHCDMMFSTDELFNAGSSFENEVTSNITVEYCLFAWALRDAGHDDGDHPFGPFVNYYDNLCFHHNIIAFTAGRIPEIKNPGSNEGIMHFANNIICVVGDDSVTSEIWGRVSGNHINNLYIYPNGKNRIKNEFRFSPAEGYGSLCYQSGDKYKLSNGVIGDAIVATGDYPPTSEALIETPDQPPLVSATVAYYQCLENSGALPRDDYSRLAINYILSGDGFIIDNPSELVT